MSGLGRARAALARRLRGPYAGIDRIGARLDSLEAGLERLHADLATVRGELEGLRAAGDGLRADLANTLRAVAADEPGNRRLLAELRARDDYPAPWTEEGPLVSVTVATIGRPELTTRALPSILAQTHRNLEVIVAGDGAPGSTAAAISELGDGRVRYLDLGPRQGPFEDPARSWLVGATRPRNAAVAEAAGRWIVEFDDDDALRPNCIEALLELAREDRSEVVYGQVRQHAGSAPVEFCEFPPSLGHFSWAAGMYHSGLRFFGRQWLGADLGLPGDWWLAERMLRAGVRFAMHEEVLCDAYASERERAARDGGRIPWS